MVQHSFLQVINFCYTSFFQLLNLSNPKLLIYHQTEPHSLCFSPYSPHHQVSVPINTTPLTPPPSSPDPYEAEQLIKEVDIHSVTGLLKLFLRELPEALFTNELYPRFFDAYVSNEPEYKRCTMLSLFSSLPQLNQSIIAYLLEHLVK